MNVLFSILDKQYLCMKNVANSYVMTIPNSILRACNNFPARVIGLSSHTQSFRVWTGKNVFEIPRLSLDIFNIIYIMLHAYKKNNDIEKSVS